MNLPLWEYQLLIKAIPEIETLMNGGSSGEGADMSTPEARASFQQFLSAHKMGKVVRK